MAVPIFVEALAGDLWGDRKVSLPQTAAFINRADLHGVMLSVRQGACHASSHWLRRGSLIECHQLAQGEIPDGKAPYFRLPVFNYHDGYLSTSYNATYYELAQRHPDVPRLTDLQREAIRHFNALARVRALRNGL